MSVISAKEAPSESVLKICSTVILVPFIVGFPSIMAGSLIMLLFSSIAKDTQIPKIHLFGIILISMTARGSRLLLYKTCNPQ
jgi:hypothetical protein